MQIGDIVITTGGKTFRISEIFQGSVGLRSLDESFVEMHTVPQSLIVEAGAVYRRVE